LTAELCDVEIERYDQVVVAVLSGEVDMSNATTVRQRIAEFVTPDDRALIIDLSSLSFIDSAGLHAVFELDTMLRERRQRLLVSIRGGSQVERTVDLVGIPDTISVHSDRDAALEAAHADRGD
jgi:anti-anti-sigma factor